MSTDKREVRKARRAKTFRLFARTCMEKIGPAPRSFSRVPNASRKRLFSGWRP